MPARKKPENLKKVGVSVGMTPALIAAIDAALEPGQSRSNFVARVLDNHLKKQVIKIENKLKN